MGLDEIKQARKQLSREQGTISKDWGGRIPIALIYPNSYYIGMSNLGLHVIYNLLNGYRELVCERVFWNNQSLRLLHPLSLESQRPLTDFSVLAFSISYEIDYFNVVQILRASGIPLYAAERDESHPLIIVGGPCITANPIPLSPFFDSLAIGDAEAIVPPMLPILVDGINGDREALLKALSLVPGIYVPRYSGKTVTRQWLKNLNDFPGISVVLTPDTELGDLYLMEVGRGCNWGCCFCLVSNAFRPERFRSLSSLLNYAREGLKYRKRLGLVGPSIIDHPQIEELVVKLRQMGAGLSLSSLRIRPLSDTVLKALSEGGTQTVTLAPEAGCKQLRQFIGKGISDDDIFRAVSRVAEQKMKQLKLYFMIGLPTESDEDIQAIVKMTLDIKRILDRKHGGTRLAINVASFVPKAGTPFQRQPMQQPYVLNRHLSLLRSTLQPMGIKIKSESPAWSEIQTVLARGDVRVAEVLANTKTISLAGWRKAVEKYHLDISFFAHQQWDEDQKLPWAILNSG